MCITVSVENKYLNSDCFKMTTKQYWETSSHQALTLSASSIKTQHLRDLLKDENRNRHLIVEAEGEFHIKSRFCFSIGNFQMTKLSGADFSVLGAIIDFTRQKVTVDIMKQLFELAKERNVENKIAAMFAGEHLNSTEDRAVLHVALRSHQSDKFVDGGKDVVQDVLQVLDRIKRFSDKVRSGTFSEERSTCVLWFMFI